MSDPAINSLLQSYPEILRPQLTIYWQQWTDTCQNQQIEPEAYYSAEALLNVWAASDFIARQLIRKPAYAEVLSTSKDLLAERSAGVYQQQLATKILGVFDDAQLMTLLRDFRNYEMLRIAWRDLENLASTQQTLSELSWLADACIIVTLEHLYLESCQRIGEPQNAQGQALRPVVIGMGKLGAFELNFSSDIDLIFLYTEEGETVGQRVMANSEYFTRLMQRFITALNKVTADGFVFRVDMRLRPFGDSGPLLMSFAGVESYYQTQGRSWERYAMIKARIVYGDEADAKEFKQILTPFVFRRYLDFGAFSSIRKMKSLIENEISRKGLQHNIKLGEGGIREIEFIGQAFQLIRGGREPDLQIRGIVDVLLQLQKMNDLPEKTVTHLLSSYDFLRRLENRLQILSDEQTHTLPTDAFAQARICHAMGVDSWDALSAQINRHRQRVHGYFEIVFASPQSDDSDTSGNSDFYHDLWLGSLDSELAVEKLTERGYDDATLIWQQVKDFSEQSIIQHVGDTTRKRLDQLIPLILTSLQGKDKAAEVLKRVLHIVQAVIRRSVYLALLVEYPMALSLLIKLCAASKLITELLAKYPLLLDDLLDPSQLYHLPSRIELEQQLDIAASRYDDDDLEQQMDVLRHFKHSQTLRIAALDVAGNLEVFEISSQLSLLAELILHRVYQMAWMDTEEKFGRPVCHTETGVHYPQLAIIAYGKLGGQELGYSSDLDIVFVHDSVGEQQMTDGKRIIDNSVFFAKMTQRIIHILSSYTNAGRLYEVDTRLRPDGAKGLLVTSLAAFEQYQRQQAWTWEHQALLRARIVVTNAPISAEFDRIRRSVLSQARDQAKLLKDVTQMREKMRQHLGSKANNQQFQLKQDAGGLVDIEFIVQFAVLSAAEQQPGLLVTSSIIELIALLAENGCWQTARADNLINCYRHYRDLSHRRALNDEDLFFDEAEVSECRQQIKTIWLEVLDEKI